VDFTFRLGNVTALLKAEGMWTAEEPTVIVREQQIGGSGGSLEPPGPLLEPPGPLLTHLRTVYMACSECLPTRLNPLAERACVSPVIVFTDENGAPTDACAQIGGSNLPHRGGKCSIWCVRQLPRVISKCHGEGASKK
jgi:hypothetical protein